MPTKVRFAGVNHTQLPQVVSDGIALKGLPQTAGYPTGYGDLASALGQISSGSGILCAAIGDSRLANSFQNQDLSGWTRNYRSNQGAITWLSFLTNQRINLPVSYDLAVGGTGTTVIRASVSNVLALSPRPSVCFINGGTNDFLFNPDLELAEFAFGNISQAALELAANGILPIIEIDTPRTTASWTATSSTVSAIFNQLLRDWCRSTGILLVDYESQYIQNDGEPSVGYNVADGIHQSCTGAVVRALKYAEVMNSFLPAYVENSRSVRDAFAVTLNPEGNLISSISLMTGTGGTNTGTGASGSVSTGWTNRVISGTMTAVASKESPRADGILGDRLIITATATTASEYRLSPTNNPVTTGNYPFGTQCYGQFDVEITSLSGVIDYIRLVVSDFDGSTEGSRSYDMKDVFATGLNPLPLVPLPTNTGVGNIATTLKGTMKTELITVGQNLASIQLIFRIEAKMAAGSAFVMKVGSAVIKQVM